MKAQPVIDRLKAECPSLGERVHHVARVTEIEYTDVDTPVAFVVTRPPTFQGNDGMGALHNQPMRRRIAVFLRAMAPTGDSDPLLDAADEITAALIGWPGDHRWFEADDPEEQAPEGHLLTWILNFSYQDYERHVR